MSARSSGHIPERSSPPADALSISRALAERALDGTTTPDFAQQSRNAFDRLCTTMAEVGGTLDDITTMTAFITGARFGSTFTEMRGDFFERGYPASALITVAGLARPEMLAGVQAIAVIDD